MPARRRYRPARFDALLNTTASTSINTAFDSASRPVLMQLRSLFAPHRRTGNLERTLRIRRNRRTLQYRIGIFDNVFSSSFQKRAHVARFLEYGTKRGILPHRYLTTVFEANASQASNKIVSAFRQNSRSLRI